MTGDEYWEDVVDTVRDMWTGYELESIEDAHDALSELAAGHATCTATCIATMQHTNNARAAADFVRGLLGGTGSWSETIVHAAYFAYLQDLTDEALTWTEEDILDARSAFRCRDCGEVRPLEEAEGGPDYPPTPSDLRCEECHADYLETLAEEDGQG